MKSLALEVGIKGIAAARITDEDLPVLVVRVPIPPLDGWIVCRDLLLDVAGDDEIAAIGIASLDPGSDTFAAPIPTTAAQWPTGSELKSAVQRTFPAAAIYVAPYRTCVSLAESHTGGLPSEELALIGAGILTQLANEHRPVEIFLYPRARITARTPEGSPIPPRACTHQSIRWRYQDIGYT
ncbi:hypothetical protein HGA13_00060 [Nocardia speluncae]|uniref:Uncharacterized protein n=1 Tax=Nocardia speluncae TaxID=419477 RepID=A0A846X8Z1_9NOCA|nr:hypothetical protein [Nocardia speluncae]NKY31469.1 hypothetical protein [Nocardia speluncae]